MIQTFFEGEFCVTEKLLSSPVSCSGGSTVDNDSVGTNGRQNTFPTFMYLVPNIFLFTELKHNIYARINGLFYLSHDFGKNYLKRISHQLHFAFKNHLWDWSTGWCAVCIFYSEKLSWFPEKCCKAQEMHTFSMNARDTYKCNKRMYGLTILVEFISVFERKKLIVSVNCGKVIQ